MGELVDNTLKLLKLHVLLSCFLCGELGFCREEGMCVDVSEIIYNSPVSGVSSVENTCLYELLLQVLQFVCGCVMWLLSDTASPMKGHPVMLSSVERQPERDSATCFIYVNCLFRIFFTVMVALKK